MLQNSPSRRRRSTSSTSGLLIHSTSYSFLTQPVIRLNYYSVGYPSRRYRCNRKAKHSSRLGGNHLLESRQFGVDGLGNFVERERFYEGAPVYQYRRGSGDSAGHTLLVVPFNQIGQSLVGEGRGGFGRIHAVAFSELRQDWIEIGGRDL